MQTFFSAQQLQNPDLADADRILRACVHCGFCNATCPTYLLTGDELDGPRGRIYLAKDMLEKGRPADAATVKHLDRCLTCQACMTTCPSGVNYLHLVDHARRHIENTWRRPWRERALRGMLARVLPYPRRFALALRAARLARPVRSWLPASLRRLVDFAASGQSKSNPDPTLFGGHAARPGAAFQRVALLGGCVQPALRASINTSTVRLLGRCGIEAFEVPGTGCCGALVHHLGRTGEALAQARADIDAWTRQIERPGLDAIITNASGCGTMLKDYAFLFRDDPRYAAKAAAISALARDVCEVLAELPAPAGQLPPLRVAYQSACSLQHGQGIHELPAELLRRVGFNVLGIPEAHVCCGSAGTYNLLQGELADELRLRKLRNIDSVAPDVIATGNIGCLTQLAAGTKIPVVHTVELLDWATGGPRPADIRPIAAET